MIGHHQHSGKAERKDDAAAMRDRIAVRIAGGL